MPCFLIWADTATRMPCGTTDHVHNQILPQIPPRGISAYMGHPRNRAKKQEQLGSISNARSCQVNRCRAPTHLLHGHDPACLQATMHEVINTEQMGWGGRFSDSRFNCTELTFYIMFCRIDGGILSYRSLISSGGSSPPPFRHNLSSCSAFHFLAFIRDTEIVSYSPEFRE